MSTCGSVYTSSAVKKSAAAGSSDTHAVHLDDAHVVPVDPEKGHGKDAGAAQSVRQPICCPGSTAQSLDSLDDAQAVSLTRFERESQVVVELNVVPRRQVRPVVRRIDEERV